MSRESTDMTLHRFTQKAQEHDSAPRRAECSGACRGNEQSGGARLGARGDLVSDFKPLDNFNLQGAEAVKQWVNDGIAEVARDVISEWDARTSCRSSIARLGTGAGKAAGHL